MIVTKIFLASLSNLSPIAEARLINMAWVEGSSFKSAQISKGMFLNEEKLLLLQILVILSILRSKTARTWRLLNFPPQKFNQTCLYFSNHKRMSGNIIRPLRADIWIILYFSVFQISRAIEIIWISKKLGIQSKFPAFLSLLKVALPLKNIRLAIRYIFILWVVLWDMVGKKLQFNVAKRHGGKNAGSDTDLPFPDPDTRT